MNILQNGLDGCGPGTGPGPDAGVGLGPGAGVGLGPGAGVGLGPVGGDSISVSQTYLDENNF